ncbi:aldehyde dehydrogenase family protein [Ramlibacter sp. 2FC]|uniref:L-piperidine-6-carboxylate dehydrogenase n=1 Tax=Ramlibacter sp. 2FC TaxID=2502188 RepID=UPI0010F66E73|nr:aldehyde dehydrogenase family protein [Ramlibacter sp. 2FC]
MTSLPHPQVSALFQRLGVALPAAEGGPRQLGSRSPIDGAELAQLPRSTPQAMEDSVQRLKAVQGRWAALPAPQRGELLRQYGLLLRQHKQALGELVTLETGKIGQEGLGEVQEMIDICDYALGLSRQLFGLVIASERPEHKMLETWHPFGICGVISAFNFPVAVWAWNAALALVCGNGLVWKPSPKTPLCALAVHGLLRQALEAGAPAFAEISQLWLGQGEEGQALVDHPDIRLISATGSTAMGRAVGQACALQFKRAILELGGNNAAVVCASADLDLALRAMVFAAVGTAGQRCTTLRRVFVHESVYDALATRLKQAYASVAIGDPREAGTLVGPLIDARAGEAMQAALAECRIFGNTVTGGERLLQQRFPEACYVRPALVETEAQHATMLRETFAPILYLCRFKELDQAIALNNAASHGLSSCIFTDSLREAERFTSALGSDCGIVNVNIGTSGAEIGGAFGGEKETGGGRESGSDAWKSYMRRATNTINYGRTLPLAQGIRFDV